MEETGIKIYIELNFMNIVVILDFKIVLWN